MGIRHDIIYPNEVYDMLEQNQTFSPVQLFSDECPKIKAYYKHELAKMYSVCTKTFSAWIHMYSDDLQQFGYKKTTKLLRPEIVRFLFERLGEP